MRLTHFRGRTGVVARGALLCALVTAFTLSASSVAAQQGAGVRAGVAADPSQFYFGGHYWSEPIVESLRFQPNVEVGIGDDLTLIAANIEFAWWIPLPRSAWNVYLGGGPALNVYSYDEDRRPRGADDTDVKGGLNFLVGLASRQGLFFEMKVGAIDSPGFKFGVG